MNKNYKIFLISNSVLSFAVGFYSPFYIIFIKNFGDTQQFGLSVGLMALAFAITGRITNEMYDTLLRDYKEKQAELLSQMQDHSDADEQFYLTANMTLNIAKRAKEIFMSSEVDEKRQFLGFLLQNCSLNEKKLEFTMRSPFNLILNSPDNLTMRKR